MTGRHVGIVVSGDKIIAVDAIVPDEGPIVLQSDQTWKLQNGARETAYHVLYQQCVNYIREHGIERVILKSSAVTMSGTMKKAHLESAEVRGVIIAAAASVCPVRTIAKSTISRRFGDRNADEYIKDDEFWSHATDGVNLRNGSREAALILIADRDSA
jgi:hypothetical protein